MQSPGRLMRKRKRAAVPVTNRSMALFRLGEICNNQCPMCSNSGRPEALFVQAEELMARVDRLQKWGFRRVILTGGEPTIHPAFMQVASALKARGITFDLNTHGRTFCEPEFADRCVALGLERAIVSLHSHKVDVSREMSGFSAQAHDDTIAGIKRLIDAGVRVMLNLVLSQLNIDHLPEFVRYCADTFDGEVALKFCFPFTGGKGGDWPAIAIRYDEVRGPLAEAHQVARELDLAFVTESVPNCVHGRATARDGSRSGFGETHYLDDITGTELYAIRYIEAQLKVWPASCEPCVALPHCPGVQQAYIAQHGTSEFTPWPPESRAD
ncbi:MAG: radical SAM protein [Myxococcales bacterium]|nr:radical SAM protein [Myxococcales bacterium]